MKYLLLIDSLTGAGAQRQLVNLAIGLQSRGHKVSLATYAPKNFFHTQLITHGIDRVYLAKNSRFDVKPVIQLAQTVHHLKPNVLIAFLRTPSVYAELVRIALPHTRLIVSERSGIDVTGFSRADYLAGFGHRLAHRIVTNSEDYLGHLLAVHPTLATRASVIYNGLDERYFANAAYGPASRRPADGQTRFCVVASRATRQKAPDVLVEALGLLLARGINTFSVDWIGPVTRETTLVRHVEKRIDALSLGEHWNWLGACDDTSEIYARYDALISPSLFEGVSNTMCEALCSGLPVVATDIADNRLILENGKTGLLCAPDDPEALANAIAAFLERTPAEREFLSSRSHARARSLFDLTRYVDRWEALCREVTAS